ncbi:type II toxin-antitoxin system HicB family antitoxin [Candidatus Microgenomates bacterium]|nr:type II toxin-antitoxin system HicB family antitoxin [Candidatus Microgenomates bacterium]
MRNHRTLTVKEYELPVSVQKEADGGFVAKCPIWSDCYAQGDTLEEAVTELQYVASSLIELYEEEDIREIKSGTMSNILKQAGITNEKIVC